MVEHVNKHGGLLRLYHIKGKESRKGLIMVLDPPITLNQCNPPNERCENCQGGYWLGYPSKNTTCCLYEPNGDGIVVRAEYVPD